MLLPTQHMSIIFSRVNLLRSAKENAYHSCTVQDVETVSYATRFHGLDAILDRPGTFYLDLMCSIFSPGSRYLFCDTRSQMIFCLLQACL